MRRLAWALFALTALQAVLQVVLLADSHDLSARRPFENGWPIITLACVAGAFLGALIIARYPRHPVGWLLLVAQVGTMLGLLAQAYALHALQGHGWGSIGDGRRAAWFSTYVSAPWALAIVSVLFLIAPDGRLLSPRWRVALAASVGGLALTWAGVAISDPVDYDMDGGHGLSTLTNVLVSVGVLAIAAGLAASAVALVRRLRAADGEARLQLRWIAAAASFLAGMVILLLGVGIFARTGTTTDVVLETLLYLAYASLPVATGVAVLRHRLYDIDVIVNRAVLFTLATAFVSAGYVGVVLLVAGSAGTFGVLPSLLTTALVAMAFQPLRLRVVRLADRLAYGRRAAPYEALSEFVRRLGDAVDPEQLLPAVAAAAGDAVSASAVVVRVAVPGVGARRASWPGDAPGHPPAPGAFVVPIAAGSIGAIEVSLPRGRPLRAEERSLLDRLAEQTALALANAGLSAELAARVAEADRAAGDLADSRERVIAARDEERSRLERSIRRQVLPHLMTLPEELRGLSAQDCVRQTRVAVAIQACTEALEALRDITRGVYPAQLARAGLGQAISSHLARGDRGTLEVTGDAVGRRFDDRVEAATYFCFAEGLRDFAPPVLVRLGVDGTDLVLTLTGSADTDSGVQRMSDRLDTLGGMVARDAGLGPVRLAVRVPVQPAASSAPQAAAEPRATVPADRA